MKKLIAVLLYVLLTHSIYSEELNKEKFIVEWGQFEGNNLSLSNQLLLSSISNYFSEHIQKEHNHYTSNEESRLIYNNLKTQKIDDKLVNRSKILNARDELLFSTINTDEKYEELNKSIADLTSEITDIENINISKLDPISNLPIEYLPTNLPYKSLKDYEIKNYLLRENIDYYISGFIDQDEDNLFLTLKLYSKYRKSAINIWSGIGTNEEILNYRDEMLIELNRYIISPNLREVVVDVEPKDGLIYINNSFKSLGYFKGSFLSDDLLELSVLKEGYQTHNLSMKLEKNEYLNIELTPNESQTIYIDSKPGGAELYYGSKYIGVTPLNVPVYSYALKLTLSLEGYMDQSISIDKDSRDYEVVLNKGIFDREENFVKEKKNFFIASAIFSFSLAVPLFFSAQNDNIESSVQYAIPDVVNYISIGNAVLWGCNLFYRLYQYLKAAEISVE